MDRAFFFRNLWRWKCGMPEIDLTVHKHKLQEAKTNWFPEFISLMRNRMTMGIYRHGHFHDPNQPNYDRVGSAIARLKLYQEDGNGEHLVGAANMCGIEFTKKAHPRFHFTATDDGVHAEIKP